MTQTSSDLDVALAAESWIDSLAVDTEAGVVWARTPKKRTQARHSLYLGSAGIALFYAELFRATGNETHLKQAKRAAEDLAAYIKQKDKFLCSIFEGWASYVFVFNEIADATGDDAFRDMAIHCLDRLHASSVERGNGIAWVEPMPFSDIHGFEGEREIYDLTVGAAGAGLVMIYAHEHGLHDSALAWAQKVADRLLEVAEPTEQGMTWGLMNDMPFQFTAPNFAHGGAGVAYFLARLYEHCPNTAYLDAAIAGARHLQAIAHRCDGGGHLIYHTAEGDQDRFYLGQCHGPAGTARLFYVLSHVTKDPSWDAWGHSLMEGLMQTGIPETRTDGLWNNVSQCCGDAGIGDYALFLYRQTGETNYLAFAERIAAGLRDRAEPIGDGLCWPQAEHRARPDFIEAQSGYMQGAAGIGSFFLHLHGVKNQSSIKIAFPDSPYGEL